MKQTAENGKKTPDENQTEVNTCATYINNHKPNSVIFIRITDIC